MNGNATYEQNIGFGRGLLWAPFGTVGIIVRVSGVVPPALLTQALVKLRTMHPALAGRVILDERGTARLTTDGVDGFPLEVRTRHCGDDWAGLILEQEKLPFDLEHGPLARFFLLQGEQSSDLVLAAPHLVCDAYSAIGVVFDAVSLLNDPRRPVEQPLPPPELTRRSVPHGRLDNLVLRAGTRLLCRAYQGRRVRIGQAEYEEMNRCYWSRESCGLVWFELPPAETAALAARCRKHGVSMGAALAAAFVTAHDEVRPGSETWRRRVRMAVNVRDRLISSPGRAVGLYASTVQARVPRAAGRPFWAVARGAHRGMHRALRNRALVFRPLVLDDADPMVLDALLAELCRDEWRRDTRIVGRLLQMQGMQRCLNFSNLGRLEVPELGSPYRIETMFPFQPLAPAGRMALSAVTVGGKMVMNLRFRQNELGNVALQIGERALRHLTSAEGSELPT